MLTIENESIKPFKDKNEFSMYIELYAIKNGVGIIPAILQYCEDSDTNIENIRKLVSESLKEKLEEEAVSENFMLRRNTKSSLF